MSAPREPDRDPKSERPENRENQPKRDPRERQPRFDDRPEEVRESNPTQRHGDKPEKSSHLPGYGDREPGDPRHTELEAGQGPDESEG